MSLRTLLVGFGRVAAGYAADPLTARYYPYASHAQVLAAHPDYDWVAVADPDASARQHARQDWGIPHVYATLEEAADAAPDVAIIATPPAVRVQVIEALPTLRAILVEKPLGRTAAEAAVFVAACAARGILLQVNYWRRADAQYRALAAGQLAAQIGAVQAVQAVYGNGLRNNGSHLIDFIRMLCGDVQSAQPLGTPQPAGPLPSDHNRPFALHLANGATALCAALDFAHYREIGLDIWGTHGRLSIWQEGLWMGLAERRPHRALSDEYEVAADAAQPQPVTIGAAYYAMFDDLAQALHTGSAVCSPGHSALATEYLVEALVG